MARYMQTAGEANKVAKELMKLIDQESHQVAASMIAQLVNLGIRCSPRGVQHTVRLNAVTEAVKGLPIRVQMEERTDPKTNRSYHALSIRALTGGTVPLVGKEGSDDEA